MDIHQLLDIIEWATKYYIDEKRGTRFGLMEYFSLTDLKPIELADIAVKHKRGKDSIRLREFAAKHFWGLLKSDLNKRVNLFHSVNGYVLTEEDKLDVFTKLQREGFPPLEGIIDKGFSYYVKEGIDSICMTDFRDSVIRSYFTSQSFEKEKGPILVKQNGKINK